MRRRGVPEGQFGPWSNPTNKPCDDASYAPMTSLSSLVSTVSRAPPRSCCASPETIGEKNAGLQSIAEPWADTTTPAGRMVLTVFGGIAEFERSLIATRTEEGRRAAQARGVSFGRPPKLRPDQRTLARNLIEEGKSVSGVARTFNVHVATIYRCLHDEAAFMTVHRSARTHGPVPGAIPTRAGRSPQARSAPSPSGIRPRESTRCCPRSSLPPHLDFKVPEPHRLSNLPEIHDKNTR